MSFVQNFIALVIGVVVALQMLPVASNTTNSINATAAGGENAKSMIDLIPFLLAVAIVLLVVKVIA